VEGQSIPEQAPGHPEIVRILAPNPGPMTLAGTNTYLYGKDPVTVIDPGPDDPGHIELVRRTADDLGGIGAVAVTHSHGDHVSGLALLGIEPTPLEEGLAIGGLEAVATPGHATDHFCLFTGDGVCFSGDLILGTGSSYVPPDGGSLAAYMDSLRTVGSRDPALICPGHGPWITDPPAKLAEYVEHRESRERALIEALERGERSRIVLLAEVWSDVPEELRPAAAIVMEAHLAKLGSEGRLPDDLAE
jgi:glyoxylase-like metal-dependent hydrolase (beta-lactamase superfamily II)